MKIVVIGLLVLAIFGCIMGVVTADVFVYILCFTMLVAAILFGLLNLTINFMWKLLPADFRKTPKAKRGRFRTILLFCIFLFLFLRAVISKNCLLDAQGLIGLLSNTAIFILTVFWGWCLIRLNKIAVLVAGNFIFILFIAILTFVNSTTLKSGGSEDIHSTEKLMSIGYLAWVPTKSNVGETGVTQYNPKLAFKGINIYKSRPLPEARLIDMRGNTVHKWDLRVKGGSDWHHVEMCENGDLLAVSLDQMLVRLDWNSNVKWKKKMRVHHDVSIDEKGRIYTIGREDKLVFWHNIPVPILSDYIMVLSPKGELMKKIYLYDLVKKQISLSQVIEIYFNWILRPIGLKKVFNCKIKYKYICGTGTYFDIMHTNSIEIMDRDIEGFCKKGDWLVSIRELDLVGIIDSMKAEFTWSWGPGELNRQHHPTLLKNGNVLIFDNGRKRQFSRIVELNPLTKKVVWEYKSKPLTKFFSSSRGCSQRLPNDNTLITESNKGRVFEITKEGTVVWEFYNPDVDKKNEKRAAIYRMMRIVNPKKYPHLKKLIK